MKDDRKLNTSFSFPVPGETVQVREIDDLGREELLEILSMYARNWLAHDGAWFLSMEREYGLDAAIKIDAAAWEIFTVAEAQRIMRTMGIREYGGIPSLIQALKFRLYARVNTQEITRIDDKKIIFKMKECRVQRARKRDNRPDFPCKPVGLKEYRGFARAIDPRIKTRCITCPPDPHPQDYWCAWEFEIDDE